MAWQLTDATMIARMADGTATAGTAVGSLRSKEHMEGEFIMQIARRLGLPGQRLFAQAKQDMQGIWIAMGTVLGANDLYAIKAGSISPCQMPGEWFGRTRSSEIQNIDCIAC